MPESALIAARYPTQDDGPYGGEQIQAAVLDIERYVVPRFDTAVLRDLAYSLWTQAGHALEDGMTCWTKDTRRQWTWTTAGAGKWALSGGSRPYVSVRRTTLASLGASGWLGYTFTDLLETTDTGMWSATAPSRLIAPVDGLYHLDASVGFSSTAMQRYLGVAKNLPGGAGVYAPANVRRIASAGNVTGPELTLSTNYRLLAGEWLEVCYYTGAGDASPAFAEGQNRAELLWVSP